MPTAQGTGLSPSPEPSHGAALEVLAPGIACSVQDAGRFGHRAIGVPLAGAADGLLLACANALLGNAAGAAAIEIPLAGPTLHLPAQAAAPVGVALAGDAQARLARADGTSTALKAWCSATLFPGDTLAVGVVRSGLAYLALSGGCAVATVLGSRATYTRAALGGIQGRALMAGHQLPCAALQGSPWMLRRARSAWQLRAGPLRVMVGPQQAHFDATAYAQFLSQPYVVSRDADRMGLRLQGAALAHASGYGPDIISEAVVPGAIQVPGNGQLIILGVDAQTVGGYAKIACVISADLPRLAQLRAGDAVRFIAVTAAQALQARREQAAAWAAWQQGIQMLAPGGEPDLAALYSANLISGMLDAQGR